MARQSQRVVHGEASYPDVTDRVEAISAAHHAVMASLIARPSLFSAQSPARNRRWSGQPYGPLQRQRGARITTAIRSVQHHPGRYGEHRRTTRACVRTCAYHCFVPRRTNPFQATVFLLQKHIAGDATVTESAELIDLVSGERREVDVCIETRVANHDVVISLECRDHGRPQSIGWIEEMHSKHSRLSTNLLVLVSSSGFTRNAVAAAQSYGIETVVPEELTDERADKIADRARRLRYTTLDLQITSVRVWAEPTGTEEEEVFLAPPKLDIFRESGEFIGPLEAIVEGFKQNIDYGEVIFDAPEETKRFEVLVDSPEITADDPATRYRLHVQKIEPQLHLRPVKRIMIEGDARVRRSDFPLRYGQMQGVNYSWGEASFEDRPAVAVVTKARDSSKFVLLCVTGSCVYGGLPTGVRGYSGSYFP